MNIKRNSIEELCAADPNNPFYILTQKLASDRQYAVMLDAVKFTYETNKTEPKLTMKAFKEVFYDAINDPEIKPIRGTVNLVDYKASKEWIDLCIFCGGITCNPTSRQDLPIELRVDAEETLKLYWHEIEKHFTLPPTRVYEHVPKYGDTLFGDTMSWYFCFIYLDDNLGQGIVLSGSTFN